MTVTNYSDLQAEVIDYTHRSDMSSRLPTFIQMCEADMRIRLKLVDFESTATTTITDSEGDLPADFKAMRACYWDGNQPRPLQYVTPDYYNAMPEESSDPSFYTIVGTTIKVKPNGDGSLVMNYEARFNSLASANTNAIITNYPDAYLHGTLMQFHVFVRNPEGVQLHQALYEAAIYRIKTDNAQRKWAGPLQVRPR